MPHERRLAGREMQRSASFSERRKPRTSLRRQAGAMKDGLASMCATSQSWWRAMRKYQFSSVSGMTWPHFGSHEPLGLRSFSVRKVSSLTEYQP